MERLLSGEVASPEGLTSELDLQNGTSAERFEALSATDITEEILDVL
jgi:hypothetical protein